MSGRPPGPPEHGPARRARVRALLAAAAVAVLGGGVSLALRPVVGAEPPPPTAVLTGRVVDEAGAPLAAATVEAQGARTRSDARGGFRLVVPAGPLLVRGDAEGHLPRTQAAVPGVGTTLRLTSRADATVSLRFGGDVMFGRRFYDRDEDGDRSDGLLPAGASVADHAALLEHVQPLLADADLTVVNLESPVLDEPWFDPTGPRPPVFHPTKEFVFASAPASVPALAEAGVDVVALGNNHMYDALDPGLTRTLEALDAAGLPHAGAGRTVDEAWAPAVVERKGQTFAFLSCTTITGTEHAVSYVADETHGGAARCTRERLEREVRAARGRAGQVVVMLHGGEEYERDQTALVRDLTAVAVGAGATVAVNGHPHVVGGVAGDGRRVVAETMGNLLFDQTVWPTFLSYLLRVDVRDGLPLLTTIDPLLLEDYLPRPAVGLLADAAARRAAGLPPGDLLLREPGAVSAGPPRPAGAPRTERLAAGAVARLAPGWSLGGPPTGPVDVGEDLLWDTGSFEDMDTDPGTAGAHLWSLGAHAEVTAGAACSGERGVALRRGPASTDDVVASPGHRQLVPPGTRLTLYADVRDASPGSTLELRWYPDTEGPSRGRVSLPVPEVSDAEDCTTVRLDAEVPEGVVAVQPYVRLAPPGGVHLGAQLAVDDVRLVAWAEPGSTGRRYDTVAATGDATVALSDDRADGGTDPAARPPFADVALTG